MKLHHRTHVTILGKNTSKFTWNKSYSIVYTGNLLEILSSSDKIDRFCITSWSWLWAKSWQYFQLYAISSCIRLKFHEWNCEDQQQWNRHSEFTMSHFCPNIHLYCFQYFHQYHCFKVFLMFSIYWSISI